MGLKKLAGVLAGGVAHEINNPLAIINAHAEDLQDSLEDENLDSDMVASAVDSISKTAHRISKIIKGLKTISRDGENDPFNPVSMGKILDESKALAGKKLTDLPLDTSEYLNDLVIDCRETQITQVMTNLISNAADAAKDLEEKWVKISSKVEGNFVYVSVTDSGKGIPKEIQDKMFQPFFTTKDVGKGTGLGVAISKGLVESHNGTLTINNQSSNTELIVKLPIKQA